MKEEVLKLINNSNTAGVEENYVSFTTDAWSSSVNDTSLLSLTAHWIDSQFKRTSAILHAQCLTESHTGEYIAAQILTMLGKWDIALQRVHVVITDNANNMMKAMHDTSLPHFGCFAHSLKRAINDVIAICKSILLDIFIVLLLLPIILKGSKKASCSTAQTKTRFLNKVELHILCDEISTRTKNGFSSLCC